MRGKLILPTLLLAAFFLVGCATMVVVDKQEDARAPARIVAVDLVNALMQIENMHPSEAKLHMLTPDSVFMGTLREVLEIAGYGVRIVDEHIDGNFVDYAISKERDSTTYQINVANIKIKRSYTQSAGRVHPASDLFVHGTDASSIRLNEQIFGAAKTQPAKQLPLISAPQAGPSEQPTLDIRTGRGYESAVYREGEAITVSISATIDSRVYCYYQDGFGDVVRLFPNRFTPDSRLNAGEVLELPGDYPWKIQATRSGYFDEIMCFADAYVADAEPPDSVLGVDLQSLPVTDLEQVYQNYRAATGFDPVKRTIDVEVI